MRTQVPRPHLSTDLELSLQEVLDLLRERRVMFWHAEVGQPRVMLYIDDAHLGKWDAGVLWAGLSREDGALLDASLRQVVEEGGCFDVEYPLTYAPGEQRWCHFSGFCPPPEMHLGGPTRLMGLMRDVTAQTDSYARSLEQAALLRGLCEQSMVGITIKGLDGRFILNNTALNSYADHPAESDDLTGRESAPMFSPELMSLVDRLDREALSTGQVAVGEIDLELAGRPMSLRMSKQPFWRGGEVVGTVSFTTDVTERRMLERRLLEHSAELEARVRERTAELQAINDRLHHAAMHDTLTGLPNRAQLAEWSLDLLGHAPRPDESPLDDRPLFGLLLIDLDHFKRINDRFGHLGGDSLLHALAQRLVQNLPGARVCRLGGDEFVVLLDDLSGPEAAVHVAEGLMTELRRPFTLDGREVQVGMSIGVTFAWTRHARLQDLLDEADMAMYTEKRTERHVRVFEPWMRERHRLLQDIQDDLPGAAERGELSVVFQPVVDLRRQKVQGAEALVRWRHPRHGLIGPGEFVPVAEAQGYITAIDLWVLREAGRQLLPLIRAGRIHQLAVNFSAQHFSTPDFVGRVQTVLRATGLPLNALVVEITESMFMENHQSANLALRELIRLGASVAADDFGTGYSSLSYLQSLPLRTIKIDRSFVATSAQHTGIIRSIVEIAHALNLRVVAEGIETDTQLGVLRDLGCDYGQGYLLARPMPIGDLDRWLRDWDAAALS